MVNKCDRYLHEEVTFSWGMSATHLASHKSRVSTSEDAQLIKLSHFVSINMKQKGRRLLRKVALNWNGFRF